MTTPLEPTIVSQEPSGLITIDAQPIHQLKGMATFNLCGISTVHSSALPPLTHTDLLHPSSITLGTDQMPAMQFLQHWTAVLEQIQPSLKGLIRVVVMIDHTAIHGHQDFSPKKIIMTIPKQRITYQVPPTAFQQVLPQHLFDLQTAPTPLPAASQSPQTFPPPPTPPQSWQRQTPTPTREESTPNSSEDMSLQTSTSNTSSSRASSPGSSASVTLSALHRVQRSPPGSSKLGKPAKLKGILKKNVSLDSAISDVDTDDTTNLVIDDYLGDHPLADTSLSPTKDFLDIDTLMGPDSLEIDIAPSLLIPTQPKYFKVTPLPPYFIDLQPKKEQK